MFFNTSDWKVSSQVMIFEKENVMLMTGHVMCINEMGKELSAFHLLGLAYPITLEFI